MGNEKRATDKQEILDTTSIKIGYGLGDIMFGSAKEECLKYLGKPDEEEIDVFDGDQYIRWYYDRLNIELCFEGSENYRLGTIIIENPNALLGEEKIMGRSIEYIENYLKKNNYPYMVEEDDVEDDNIVLIDVDDMECTFMFRDNRLEAVQWSYLWLDDNTPQWPEKLLH